MNTDEKRELKPCIALTYRTIDPAADGRFAYENYVDACRASFGPGASGLRRTDHAKWLRSRVEEFPDGHVLALLGDRCVGQLELQVPYGLTVGYVNLFCVTPAFRGQGYGRVLHDYAERYFRSWEASRITLDVGRANRSAIGFYRHLGYELKFSSRSNQRMWRMEKSLVP